MNEDNFWNEPNLGPTKVKRQHYVPQLFLRAFSLDDKIRVVDLNEGREYRTSIANVAVESHFYDEDIADIQLSTEDWLAQLEGHATPVVEKLLSDPDSITSLSDEEEMFTSRFLVALLFRTPAFRDYNDKFFSSTLQQIKGMVKRQIYHVHKENADTIWEEIKDKPDHWWFEESEPQQSSSITNFMLGEVQGFANILRAAPWRIGTAPDSICLYTSDNPVAGYLRPVRPWWEHARFAALDYFVPLSPKVLLKIEHRPYNEHPDGELQRRGGRCRNDFSAWEISFARHLVTQSATRYLYGDGPVIPRDCAASCLERIRNAQLEFAILYLGFDPRPPSLP
jgi:hypothetical protein